MKKNKLISEHYDGKTFRNRDSSVRGKNFFAALKMWFSAPFAKWPATVENKATPYLLHTLTNENVAITFINHVTFLIQLPGLNILTDPVWSKRVSPFSWLGPSRVRKPGLSLDDLPKIDLILISHNHYDHLDVDTLKKLNQAFSPKIFVPIGDGKLVKSLGFNDIQEFDWWESAIINQDCKITFTPTQHFSSRSLFDRNRSLWGSYMIENHDHKIYFGGDAGYSIHFQEIYKKFGVTDIALLGIGAYEPQWFMKPMHMNPAEAVQAHQDLHAKLSIGMHFGTFQLSAEGIDQPVKDLNIAINQAQVLETDFIILNEGETRLFSL